MKTKRELGGEFKAYIILHIMASENEKKRTVGSPLCKWLVAVCLPRLRKVRDSNPRYPKGVYRISSPARSITLPTFLSLRLQS